MADEKPERKRIPPLKDNEKYMKVVLAIRKNHSTLLQWYNDDKFKADRENPAKIGELMMKTRLNCSWLASFMNDHYDLLNDMKQDVDDYQQSIYENMVDDGKSENAAKNAAQEMTRRDRGAIAVIENQIQQMKNEKERGDGIVISLQSQMKEFDTERRMG